MLFGERGRADGGVEAGGRGEAEAVDAGRSSLHGVEGYLINSGMTHTVRDKEKLLARVRRIRGQVEAVERALDREAGCEKVMHLIAAARGATSGLMAEVVEDHVMTHLVDPERHPGALNLDAAGQLLDVVRTYLR